MGANKAALAWGPGSLAAHIYTKIAAQCDEVFLSGSKDYGLPLPHFKDSPSAPKGPAAALYSALDIIGEAEGFFTVPVDAPYFPDNLCERLYGPRCAIAAAPDGLHPVFGWWLTAELKRAFGASDLPQSLSMRRLAALCHAREVRWEDAQLFTNLNRREDYVRHKP